MASEDVLGPGPGPDPELANRAHDKEWERKQRNREYRVASRREKRNRKADEKKQRKLNATILRRMTRNPDKYNKNGERNRLRDIEGERRRIWQEAIRQAQRLAAVHDPSGAMFNVSPVVLQEDGTVISQETFCRRQEKVQERAAAEQAQKDGTAEDASATAEISEGEVPPYKSTTAAPPILQNGFNPDRFAHIEAANILQPPSRVSKTQQKKRAALESRPPPPRPILPEGIQMPEGEEDWLALWDLPDNQLERRVLREKKRKAAERKALRIKQKSGKAERREARDEKRKVYRDIKLTWKAIKEEQTREKTKLKSVEDEESKKIAVDINAVERKVALDFCAALGFTLANTPGVDEIKPRALGMKGVEIDFDAIEIGENRSDVKPKKSSKRVDLSDVLEHTKAEYIPNSQRNEVEGEPEEFIKLDVGEGQDFETLNYNHKLRRKLRRAIDNAQIRKEILVRQRALDYYHEKGADAPSELRTPYKPVNAKGQRILENGTLETAKQERVRARMELAEFNTQMRVLRKQAKDAAMYAGLRKHAELTGKITPSEALIKQEGAQLNEHVDDSDLMSALENSLTPATTRDAKFRVKRDRSEDSHSIFSGEQSRKMSEILPSSENSSDTASSTSSVDPLRAKKRQKLCEGHTDSKKQQRMSTNRDRQAMIDAESALNETSRETSRKKMARRTGSLKEVDANSELKTGKEQKTTGKSLASNWNMSGLAGGKARKSKFLRLLGGEKSTVGANDMGVENEPGYISAQVDFDLEKHYEERIAYKKESKGKGLGF